MNEKRYRAYQKMQEYEHSPMTPAADDIVRKFFDMTRDYQIKDIVKALSEIQLNVVSGVAIGLEIMDEQAKMDKHKHDLVISVMLSDRKIFFRGDHDV